MAIILQGGVNDSNTGEELILINEEATRDELSKKDDPGECIWEVDGAVKAKLVNDHLLVYKVAAEKSRKWKAAKE